MQKTNNQAALQKTKQLGRRTKKTNNQAAVQKKKESSRVQNFGGNCKMGKVYIITPLLAKYTICLFCL